MVYFDCNVTFDKDRIAVLLCKNDTVAVGKLYKDASSVKEVYIQFDPWFLTQKGCSYKLVVEAGTFHSEVDPNCVSSEIVKEFTAPETFPCEHTAVYTINDIETIIDFTFGTEVKHFDGAEFICYKNGKLDGRYKVESSWDWGMGTAFVRLERSKGKFYKGNHYEFVLPKGSVHHLYDEGIINEEARMDFDGEDEEETSIIEVKEEPTVKIVCIDGALVVSGLPTNEKVAVCNTEGYIVSQGTASCGDYKTLPLSKGLYFVKYGNNVQKVINR